MRTLEWRTKDKSAWGPGPWQEEPDKRQWQDEATGLPCLIVRNNGGALCGYVGVPKGHPDHGKDYDAVDVDVHGGLTFADTCVKLTPDAWEKSRARLEGRRDEAKEYPRGDAARDIAEWSGAMGSYEAWLDKARGRYICHLPEPGEPDDVWWLGFDCAHLGDTTPAYDAQDSGRRFARDGYYKNFCYVEAQVRSLAEQLAARCGAE